jgi:uncharacterized protein (DUF924 family)
MTDPNPTATAQNNSRERLDELFLFWFGSAGPAADLAFQQAWFRKDDAFDDALREAFGDLAERALREPASFEAWRDARGTLGMMLLLDQLSRNLHRGSPRAFEADPLARRLAADALLSGLDQEVPLVARVFFYLPFEHSEDLADQRRSVGLFERLRDEGLQTDGLAASVLATLEMTLDYARKHEEVIVQFGRFPHRNAALGRESTAAELAWLAAGGGF